LGAPWDMVRNNATDDTLDVRGQIGQIAMAAMQVSRIGTTAQREAARTVLLEARKKLYRLLAEDE
jgi:hypothetical protein